MNEDDYDEDGNNIVPCPICLDKYCPSKENGICPKEKEFIESLEPKPCPLGGNLYCSMCEWCKWYAKKVIGLHNTSTEKNKLYKELKESITQEQMAKVYRLINIELNQQEDTLK